MRRFLTWLDEYYDIWYSKKGRWQLSWNTMYFLVGVTNGLGGFTFHFLSFELTRWKGSAEKVADGRKWWINNE